MQSFLREVKTWQALQHEFILPLFGVYHSGNDLFMVSPFMENGTLKTYLAQNSTEDELRLVSTRRLRRPNLSNMRWRLVSSTR